MAVIPGLNLSVDIGSVITTLFWGIIVGAVIIVGVVLIRNKLKYKYKVTIIKRRQEDMVSNNNSGIVINGKAGYFFDKKSGKTEFRIKTGPMPSQMIRLTKMPDPKHMIGNWAVYQQIQKDNLIQSKMNCDWSKGNTMIEPVEDDTKFAAQIELRRVRNLLNTGKVKTMTIAMTLIAIQIVTGIIVLYFISKG